MGFVIKYCDVCQRRIPDADLENGEAVEVGNRTFCKEHRGEAGADPERARIKKGSRTSERMSERTPKVSVQPRETPSPERARLGRSSRRTAVASSSRRSAAVAPTAETEVGPELPRGSKLPIFVVALTLMAAMATAIIIVATDDPAATTKRGDRKSATGGDTGNGPAPVSDGTGTGTGANGTDADSNGGSNEPIIDPLRHLNGALVSVRLRDGSRLIGRTDAPVLDFSHSSSGWSDVKTDDILDVVFDETGAARVQLKSEPGVEMAGRFRDSGLPLVTRFGRVQVRFEEMAGIRAGDGPAPVEGLPSRIRRIATDKDESLAGCVRLNFDTDPTGVPFLKGQNVNDAFVANGVLLRTSIRDSYVAIDDWPIESSASRGFSCANHNPRWQGELSIRFCVPGQPNQPACVTRVGLWISQVRPDGTHLMAFDIHDRRIADLRTAVPGDDFLALESRIPIARITIVPDVKIDPDYTIDDLTFDPPRHHPHAGDPERLRITLASGEFISADSMEFDGDRVMIIRPSHGDARVSMARSELAEVVWPTHRDAHRPGTFWVRLTDGSILRAYDDGNGIRIARSGNPPSAGSLAALWGDTTPYAEPETGKWPIQQEVVLVHGRVLMQSARWRFEPQHVVVHNEQNQKHFRFPLTNAPMLWFQRVARLPDSGPRIWLTCGEELTLGQQDGWRILEWSATGIVLERRGVSLHVPAGDLAAIRLTGLD